MIRRMFVIVGIVVTMLAVSAQAAFATWSVVAVDPETGEVGVAVASCVGFEVSVVPVLVPGIGAAASQAAISAASGERIVGALTRGASAAETIDEVVAADDDPDNRQFGVVVLDDGGAGWSGADTFDTSIDRRSSDGTASVQGNILVSANVVNAAIAAFESSNGDLADRLLVALVAGADEGGDMRCGDQTATAAALIVAQPGDQTYAFTDAGVLAVDPTEDVVPSIFVSILVTEGGERAPDRLVEVWENADRSGSTVEIRSIEAGADTSAERATTVVLVFLGIVAAVGVVAILAFVRHRRRVKSA